MSRGAAAAALLAACGGGSPPVEGGPATPIVDVPARAATAGDAVLARLPAGPDVLVEIDLARLRGNPVVGALAAAALADAGALPGEPLGVPSAPLARADAVILAAYRVGTAEAQTIGVLVPTAGGGLAAGDVHGGLALEGAIAVAPPELAPDLLAVAEGGAPSVAGDDVLRALRAAAMPAGAEGAVVRVTARLDFDARVALAARLELDAVPATLSVWGDVADDLAIVAVAEAPGERDELAAAARAGLDELARAPAIARVGLAPAVRASRVEPRADAVRIVTVVGPRRLARAAGRAETYLQLTREPPETP